MRAIFSNRVIYVFLLGFCLRLYACINIPIINPDGVHYILQAKALYYGGWQGTVHSTLNYITIYPFFITGAYPFCHDWIIAARSISLLFGFATLIPLYLLLKRFFNHTISTLSILIFALIPVFVSRSGDVVRGPIFWFFTILGLYFFIAQIDNKKATLIFFSNVSFLMAAWARIEAVLFIVISCFCILVLQKKNALHRLFIFVLPVLLFIVSAISFAAISDSSIREVYRTGEVVSKLSETIDQYKGLRANLRDLAAVQDDKRLSDFLSKSRNLVWLIALGTVTRYTVAAFFYPFFVIFLIGWIGIRERMRNDPRVLYFLLLVVSALSLLYMHVLQQWIIQYRFLAAVILPSCIFFGFGLDRILYFFRNRFGLKESTAIIIIVCLLLVSAVPKNLKARETDKVIFRHIGELIAKREGNRQVIRVAGTSSKFHTWVSFYANIHYAGIYFPKYMQITQEDYGQFVAYLRNNGIPYVLWEERQWPVEPFDFIHADIHRDFNELGRWSHPDTGRVILFEVIDCR